MTIARLAATLDSLGLETWLAVGSAILALVSFFLNWLMVRRQAAMQFESLKAQVDSEVLAWAHEASDAITEGIMLAKGRGDYDERDVRVRALTISQRLSSMADRGRLLFPNLDPHAAGQGREAAFRGFRPPILDCVVFASAQVERLDARNMGPDMEAVKVLVGCRRLLVSETQCAIDPRRRGEVLSRLGQRRRGAHEPDFAAAAALGESLEARYPGYLVQRRDQAWVEERTSASRKKKAS